MPAWYDIRDANLSERADLAGVRRSQAQPRGADRAREVARRGRRAHRARGLFAGWRGRAVHRPAPSASGSPASSRCRRTSSARTSSRRKPRRPIATCRSSWATARTIPSCASRGPKRRAQALVADGWRVEWHVYPMEHSAVMEEIAAVGAFLQRVAGPSAAFARQHRREGRGHDERDHAGPQGTCAPLIVTSQPRTTRSSCAIATSVKTATRSGEGLHVSCSAGR